MFSIPITCTYTGGTRVNLRSDSFPAFTETKTQFYGQCSGWVNTAPSKAKKTKFGVIRWRHCYWRCFSPPAAELNAMLPAFASWKNTTSTPPVLQLTAKQHRLFSEDKYGWRCHTLISFLQLTQIQGGGQQVNSHRYSKGQNQVPVGEHISQGPNPFSLPLDQQPRPWKYLQNKTEPAQILKLIISTTKSHRLAYYTFPYTFPSTMPLICFQLCE